jgi:anti-sigma factor RsiW
MKCKSAISCEDAAVDGELDPSARVELDRHLSECEPCRERFEFAIWVKDSVQRAARVDAPSTLRARICASLEAERRGEIQLGPNGWRSTLLVAAAALVVFGLGGALELRGPVREAGVATLLEDVLRAHASVYPAEISRREQVGTYFGDRVGFPVRPVSFADPSVRFVGARSAEVGGRHAVTFQYDQHGHRMTVVAFRRPPRADDLGEPVSIGGRPVRVVRVGGHLVPLVEHEGVVYAVVGDLGHDDGVSLAAHAALY